MWQKLLDPDIQKFIKDHQNDDIASLALKKPPAPDWPWPQILDQIKSRQKAAKKLPVWLTHKNLIFPPPDVMEQASSEATARYKAALLKANSFADLTGGSGADAAALANYAGKGTVIDADEHTAALLAHNLKILTKANITAIHDSAENALKTITPVDLILIDPQRRNEKQRGLYKLEECSPNIIALMENLKQKTTWLMLKTSPILDIPKTVHDLENVRHVHIVEYQGECKEVLYLLNLKTGKTNPQIHAAQIDDNGETIKTLTFTQEEETNAPVSYSHPQTYLYEPGPAFLKAGAFKTIAARYKLHKLAPNTHLYTSESLQPDFPGRIFKIINTGPANKKSVQTGLREPKANLTVRNFPLSVENLKKKLGIKDGGHDYLFACTLQNNEKTIIHTQKI